MKIKNRDELIEQINVLLEQETENNPVSYNTDRPYQAYERIGFPGLRWSVEKRIADYSLDSFFNEQSAVLDIGSNLGFFTTEFALHCRLCHGVEPNPWLNSIGELIAEYLGVRDRVAFFNCIFEEFENTINYDLVLSLAAFYTADGRERSSAHSYFSKVNSLLASGGQLFYESTSYTKDNDNPHYQAKQSALDAIAECSVLSREWETTSGSAGYFRQFAIATKRDK